MRKAQPPSRSRALPDSVRWWLTGEEECLHCGQLYAYELEVRCVDCDTPSCPACSGRHAGLRVCRVCVVGDARREER